MSQETEMLYKVCMSKMPRGVGLNLEFMEILLRYLWTAGCDNDGVDQPYQCALEWMEDMYVEITLGETEL